MKGIRLVRERRDGFLFDIGGGDGVTGVLSSGRGSLLVWCICRHVKYWHGSACPRACHSCAWRHF